ncbi:4Fe-4S binding protein [Raoultibacter massiliensis]|uniref:4Fe-4S binding protein n=1 Tax=Raoultibacter massiliensis TaxID=1852371 RepID=UPI003A8EB83F
MNATNFLKLLHEDIRDCAFATVDEQGRPVIRIIDIMMHDESGVYFLTARGKAFYRQLIKQHYVAITGQKGYRMVSLRGAVRQIEHDAIGTMFERNPDMAILYPGETRHIFEPFQVYAGQGDYLDLTASPIVHESFAFGNGNRDPKGDCAQKGLYRIAGSCTACGSCIAVCPQGCINIEAPPTSRGAAFPLSSAIPPELCAAAGFKAHIEATHCLNCGACIEACEHHAIEAIAR